MTNRFAACVCGQLTVSCTGEPAQVSLCHCLACQRRTGSTYGIAAFFPRESVVVAGDAKAYTRPWTVTLHQRLALNTELVDEICLENEKSSQRMK